MNSCKERKWAWVLGVTRRQRIRSHDIRKIESTLHREKDQNDEIEMDGTRRKIKGRKNTEESEKRERYRDGEREDERS